MCKVHFQLKNFLHFIAVLEKRGPLSYIKSIFSDNT